MAWQAVTSRPHRAGKWHRANEALRAWVDGYKEWRNNLISEWSSYIQTKADGAHARWLSSGRLVCLVGQDEAEQLSEALPM